VQIMTTLTSLQPSLASARRLCSRTVLVGGSDPWTNPAVPMDGNRHLEQGPVSVIRSIGAAFRSTSVTLSRL